MCLQKGRTEDKSTIHTERLDGDWASSRSLQELGDNKQRTTTGGNRCEVYLTAEHYVELIIVTEIRVCIVADESRDSLGPLWQFRLIIPKLLRCASPRPPGARLMRFSEE